MLTITEFLVLLLVALAACAVIVGYLYSARHIVQYSIDRDTLRVKILGVLTVRSVPLGDIEEIYVISAWWDTLPFSRRFRLPFLFAERWPSYVFQRYGVFIRKRTGFSRYLILSPEDSKAFVLQVERRRAAPS